MNIAEIIGFGLVGFLGALGSPFANILYYLMFGSDFDNMAKIGFLLGNILGIAFHYKIVFEALCECRCKGCKEEDKDED